MEKQPILEVKDIHLKYSFFKPQALKDLLLWRKKEKKVQFEALKGVSFNVEKGTNFGIIGSNGAGKSTLLRILANTLVPDKGSIINKAESISLLSLGVGFKPELTGYENIYLNGLLLGLSQDQIKKRMDQIISFSEIGDFIHNPVKTYSSGMKTRLSFSIAINVNPEMLLIDELFSVGDESFKEKSRKKMEEMISDNRTVIIVSHNLSMIRQYCNKVLWLDKGMVKAVGNPDEIIDRYLDYKKA